MNNPTHNKSEWFPRKADISQCQYDYYVSAGPRWLYRVKKERERISKELIDYEAQEWSEDEFKASADLIMALISHDYDSIINKHCI